MIMSESVASSKTEIKLALAEARSRNAGDAIIIGALRKKLDALKKEPHDTACPAIALRSGSTAERTFCNCWKRHL